MGVGLQALTDKRRRTSFSHVTTDAYPPAAADPPGRGGARSEGTRIAILKAAREEFALHGYERTTIRAVAAQAKIDPSMVMRYFGSKAGLFSAASTMNLRTVDLGSVPVRRRGEAFVRSFVERWERGSSSDALVILLRTAATDETVAQQLQSTLEELVTAPIAALGDLHASTRGSLIASQMLGVALCRYVVHLEPIATMPVDDLVDAVAPTIQRYLTQALG